MAGRSSIAATRVRVLVQRRASAGAEWLLLTGDRTLLTGGIVFLFGAVVYGLEYFAVVPLRHIQPLFYVYSGLIAGNITLVTVVVSINQLFLSQELQPPGELKSEIEDIAEYRHEVESEIDTIAPPIPLDFLRLLVESIRQQAQQLGGLAKGDVDVSRQRELVDVVETVTDLMDEFDARVTSERGDTFGVVSMMLTANFAQLIYRLRLVGVDLDDSPLAREMIGDLLVGLEDLNAARDYFKSVYLQEELASLSRALLLTGLPSIATSVLALLALTVPPEAPGSVLALRSLVFLTITIGLVPLSLVFAYFLRTAMVTRLTAATIPFTTPEDKRL